VAIQKKAAKKGIAKLGLNFFWGKLTESNNRLKSKMIADPKELFRFLATPGIEVTNILFTGDEEVWATWKYAEEEENMPVLRHTNEVIGAYVTAGARLKFYSYLDALKESAVYCDTDSVIYIRKCGQPPAVVYGDKLGDMSSELGPEEYIEEFVFGGPKNYAYRTVSTRTLARKTVYKVRGITLNYATSQLVNFESIRDMILDADAREVITVRTERKIKRKMRKRDGSGLPGADTIAVVSEPEAKIYRVSLHKRRKLDDFDSVPFGYIKDGQSGSGTQSVS
jgi:hypothetical protein